MGVESVITCPICRAQQMRQTSCRRCRGDLSLAVKTLNSMDRIEQEYWSACQRNDTANAQAWLKWLTWFSPTHAQNVQRQNLKD